MQQMSELPWTCLFTLQPRAQQQTRTASRAFLKSIPIINRYQINKKTKKLHLCIWTEKQESIEGVFHNLLLLLLNI